MLGQPAADAFMAVRPVIIEDQIRAAVGVLDVGIKRQERIPFVKIVMIIYLVEQCLRGRSDGGASLNAEVRRTRFDKDEENENDGTEANEDFADLGLSC